MAVLLNIGELGGVNASVTKVNQESQNSSSMNNILGDFKTASAGNELKGQIWNSEGQKIQVFMDAMKKSQNIADRLAETISKAVNALMGAWDSRFGNSIDDAYRDQIERELRAAEAELASLEAQKLDTSAARKLVEELRSLLNAIDNFLAVFATEMSNLNSVESEVEGDFGSFVAGITATASWNFNPSGMEAVQSGLDNIDDQLLDKDSALETDSLSTGLTASTNVQEPEYYSDRYISDGSNGRPKNSGTTVNYAVFPRDDVPEYYMTDNNTPVLPQTAIQAVDSPSLFMNCGFDNGVHIQDGNVQYVGFSNQNDYDYYAQRGINYVDTGGNLGFLPYANVYTNGALDEDKLDQAVEQLDISWATPAFGTVYTLNDDGSETYKYGGFAPTPEKLSKESDPRPRVAMGQYEDGDWFYIQCDGDANSGSYGMAVGEFVDYAVETANANGKVLKTLNLLDGGGSATYYVDGERVDKVQNSKNDTNERKHLCYMVVHHGGDENGSSDK